VRAMTGQRRLGRAGGGAAQPHRRSGAPLALNVRLLEALTREFVPGAGSRPRHMVDAELDPLDQADDAVGEVPGVGGRADLVADDEDLAVIGGEAQHGLDEVAPTGPEQPGGADDEVALVGSAGRLLPGQLAAAVG